MALTGLWFVCTWLFALGYPNASIERYYLVPLLAAATWVALAADVAWDALLAAASVPADAGRSGRPARASPAQTGCCPSAGPGDSVVARALPFGLVAVLLATSLAALPERRAGADASDETFGRDWLEATLAALPPGATVVSWWSYSTPLWYGRWVEGRRPDIVIVDDRDVLDGGLWDGEGAIDHFLDRAARLRHPSRAGPARPGRALRAGAGRGACPVPATSTASSGRRDGRMRPARIG